MRLDQRAAVAAAAAREPGERAFELVDGDVGAAELGDDLLPIEREMLARGSGRPPAPGLSAARGRGGRGFLAARIETDFADGDIGGDLLGLLDQSLTEGIYTRRIDVNKN